MNSKKCGVYYLWDGAQVIYVGASVNVEKRVREHARGDLDFAGYFLDECMPEQLSENESKAIIRHDPQFNLVGRPL